MKEKIKKYNITITKDDLEKFDDVFIDIDKIASKVIETTYYKEEFIILQRIICIQYERIKELERRNNGKTRARNSRTKWL